MPLLPVAPPGDPSAPPGLLGPPPGGAAGLLPPDLPPAGMGAMALGGMAEQQAAELAAFKAQQAQEAMAVAMQAIAGLPNPAAEAAQTEPGLPVASTPGTDPTMQGGL